MTKVKKFSEKLWIKLEIRHLYGKLNTFNKELFKMHLELYKIFSFIELEEILYGFGENYVNKKLKNLNYKLLGKLEKLSKKGNIRVGNKKSSEEGFAQRVVNLTEVTFTEDKQKLLDKCLKYAPPVGINREKTLVECGVIVEKMENEDTKKQMRYKLKEIV